MNKWIGLGRLVRDPEMRETRSGKKVASMTIAVDIPGARNNAQEGQPTADFIPLVAWEKSAEFCERYLKKGSKIMVEGRLTIRKYTAQDGSNRYATEVVTNNIEFADSKKAAESEAPAAYSQQPAQNYGSQFGQLDYGRDEEIPF